MKKVISFILVICMVVSMLPVMTLAANSGTSGDNPYERKTISILGESISTFSGVSNNTSYNSTIGKNHVYYHGSNLGISLADTWWQQLIDELGMELCVNNSWSGSCIYTYRSETDGAYVSRAQQLHNDHTGEEPDVIVVYLGTNDFCNFKNTLGTAESIDYTSLIRKDGDGFAYAEPTTASEAYAVMLHKILIRYPNATVYCLTLLPQHLSAANQALLEQFNASISAIAEHFDVPVVDLYADSGIKVDENFVTYIADNSLHPGPIGMDAITETIKQVMLKNIPDHVHSFIQEITAPTCTAEGYTTHTCACGDRYKDSTVAAVGHKWDEGKITTEPTEEAEGVKTYTCTACGDTKTESIAKLDHTHNYTDKVIAPTCTAEGYTTHTCACGENYKDSTVAAIGHKWDEGKITTEPTEEAEGVKTYTCTACGDTKTESIAKLDHTHNYTDKVIAPTCTAEGYTTHTCACGENYKDSTVAAVGHEWDEGKITTEPTEESEGVKTYICTACGETKTDVIEKLEPIVNPFTDVAEKDFFFQPVMWAVSNNVTSGLSATSFGPSKGCTRAQVVTFLWRAAGEPAPTSNANPFTDVKEGQYYYDAVLWAVENGITTGLNATTFGTNADCNRGQIVTFLWRAMNKPAPSGSENPFTDVPESQYYYDAVLWAVEKGITTGLSSTTFGPNSTCTRGQIVTFLYRAYQ